MHSCTGCWIRTWHFWKIFHGNPHCFLPVQALCCRLSLRYWEKLLFIRCPGPVLSCRRASSGAPGSPRQPSRSRDPSAAGCDCLLRKQVWKWNLVSLFPVVAGTIWAKVAHAVVAIYVRAMVVNNRGRGREASQISSILKTKGFLLCNYSSCPSPSFP